MKIHFTICFFSLVASASAKYLRDPRAQHEFEQRMLEADKCELKLHSNPGVNNWNEAQAFCQRQGGPGSRIATKAEYCPSGRNNPPVIGQQSGDQWVAINDEPNEWVQVGSWGGQTCLTHTEAAGVKPGWGEDNSKNPYESNSIYCYECNKFQAEYCWRDTHVRGGGVSFPDTCGPDQEKIGLLCYDKCPAGYYRWGFDCHQACPEGMRDDGIHCTRVDTYGRGAGYPWLFGDALNDSGMFHRCESDHGGSGSCEKCGLIVYPKCDPAYQDSFGLFPCNFCHRNIPPVNCEALGMLNSPLYNTQRSCVRKVILGKPSWMGCTTGEMSMGLCYSQPCQAGYNGAGPVCWSQPPPGWVECGMGNAKDSDTCGQVTSGQVQSVGDLAINIGQIALTIATGGAAAGTEFADLITKFQTFRQSFSKLDDIIEGLKTTQYIAENGSTWINFLDASFDGRETTPADQIRVAAQIYAVMGLVDPTGLVSSISGVVASYSWPMCSKIQSRHLEASRI